MAVGVKGLFRTRRESLVTCALSSLAESPMSLRMLGASWICSGALVGSALRDASNWLRRENVDVTVRPRSAKAFCVANCLAVISKATLFVDVLLYLVPDPSLKHR